MPGRTRFTIYDALDQSGYFESNPANTYARDKTTGSGLYTGPVEYPKMLFHPQGEERIVVPGEIITTPLGAKIVGEQREMLYLTVNNLSEERAALAEGYHDHPAKAIRARVMQTIATNPKITEKEKAKLLSSIPVSSSADRVKELEAELARLTGLKDEEESKQAVDTDKTQPVQTKPAVPKPAAAA